ncbi:MAG: DUF302 domain-containing protein [Euryarchaeota archaeon]|nr:DUF302 domain-containing protein [Euryarchaeota archaeon]
MKYHYTREVEGEFEEVVERVQSLVRKEGFGILAVHDFQKSFSGRGIEFMPFKMVEICNPTWAAEALKKDINLAMFMPCRINIYQKNGRVVVSGVVAGVMAEFTDADLGELPEKVTEAVRRIVDGASA